MSTPPMPLSPPYPLFAPLSPASPRLQHPRVLVLGGAHCQAAAQAGLHGCLPQASWAAATDRPAFLRQLLSFFPHVVVIEQALNTVAHGHPYLLLRRLYPAVPVFLLGTAPEPWMGDGYPTWEVAPADDLATTLAWQAAQRALVPVQARITGMRIRYEIRRNVQALGDIEAGLRAGDSPADGSPGQAWLQEIRASIAYLEQLGRDLPG